MVFWQRLFGGSTQVAYVMVLALGCSCSQRPAAVADISPDCRTAEANARILRVVGQVIPEDVEAIKGVVATISKDPVVMIQSPPGSEKMLAKYGRGVVEVRTLGSWSCDVSSGESLFVVREGGTWRVINERYIWNSIID